MAINTSDSALLIEWYRYAAGQDGFLGSWLELVRKTQRISIDRQRKQFGASKEEFLRLQGMPIPRPHQFTSDARRIAEACHLENPTELVQALLLARAIVQSQEAASENRRRAEPRPTIAPSYQAAYDAEEDLDELPDEDDSA